MAFVSCERRFCRSGALRLLGLCLAASVALTPIAAAQSVITTRPDDPAGILVAVDGTEQGDATATIQAAIDKAGASFSGGIVFVPSGRYRLTHTVYVWRSVRLVGYGATRPVFLLPPDTPGFQTGIGVVLMFSGGGPAALTPGGRGRIPYPPAGSVPPNDRIADANQGTFYSAITNIDIEIGPGNPAAVAVRFHVAQHGVLSHMRIDVGSGLAGLTQIGNEVQDLHVSGGRFGILTENTSPYWPFTVIDSVFENQRDAAIREYMAGLTVVRTTFKNAPIAIEIAREYSDELWVKDSRFENISNAAVLVSNERNAMTEVGFENAVCIGVPTFARLRESGRSFAGRGRVYRVSRFNHGLVVSLGNTGTIDTRYDAAPLMSAPPPPPPAIRALPESSSWVNVRTLGVKGDGETDDTEAIRKAIDSHPVLYFPVGYYIVRDTIALKPDTVLIALHPGLTQLDLPDRSPAFQGVGAPKAVLTAPQGGRSVVSGLGIFTGGVNPRATGILWSAGEESLIDDVQLHGFGGTVLSPAVRKTFYDASGGRGQFASGRWGAQYPSLWVRGGGGTFNNIWSPNTFAHSGFYVSDTATPGHVYQLSAEHHLSVEIKLDRVENWDFNAPQTEEEAQTSPEAVAVEINDSKNITFANYHAYRVTRSRQPFADAVRITNSSAIRFRNVHIKSENGYAICDANGCGRILRAGKYAFENAVLDVTRRLEVRERDLAVLDINDGPRKITDEHGLPPRTNSDARALTNEARQPRPTGAATVLAPGASLRKLADGFSGIAGATVDADGTLYFVDRRQQRIFSWTSARGLTVVRDAAQDPVNLLATKTGEIVVVSSAGPQGTVYVFDPKKPNDEIRLLTPQPAMPHPGAAAAVPVNIWVNGELEDQLDPRTYEYTTLMQLFAHDVATPAPRQYVSPDGSLFLPAVRVFQQAPDDSYAGMDDTGWRWSHNLDAYGLIPAMPGGRIPIISGAENRTYTAAVQADGTLTNLQLIAERGGESVAADAAGHFYVANGQVFVYDRRGMLVGQIDVPERPVQVLFGGADRRTLFVLTHRALYAVTTRTAGQAGPWSAKD